MFNGCCVLTALKLGTNFSMSQVINTTDMFKNHSLNLIVDFNGASQEIQDKINALL
jgi:hypothetical protein